eukprot:CFRG6117T1
MTANTIPLDMESVFATLQEHLFNLVCQNNTQLRRVKADAELSKLSSASENADLLRQLKSANEKIAILEKDVEKNVGLNWGLYAQNKELVKLNERLEKINSRATAADKYKNKRRGESSTVKPKIKTVSGATSRDARSIAESASWMAKPPMTFQVHKSDSKSHVRQLESPNQLFNTTAKSELVSQGCLVPSNTNGTVSIPQSITRKVHSGEIQSPNSQKPQVENCRQKQILSHNSKTSYNLAITNESPEHDYCRPGADILVEDSLRPDSLPEDSVALLATPPISSTFLSLDESYQASHV